MNRNTAYKIALDSISMRQRQYYTGHMEFLQRGPVFEFAERDHKTWTKLEEAKKILSREIKQEKMFE